MQERMCVCVKQKQGPLCLSPPSLTDSQQLDGELQHEDHGEGVAQPVHGAPVLAGLSEGNKRDGDMSVASTEPQDGWPAHVLFYLHASFLFARLTSLLRRACHDWETSACLPGCVLWSVVYTIKRK